MLLFLLFSGFAGVSFLGLADKCPFDSGDDPALSCRMIVRETLVGGVEFDCSGFCGFGACDMGMGAVRTCLCNGVANITGCQGQLTTLGGVTTHDCLEDGNFCVGIPVCSDADYSPPGGRGWPGHWVQVCCCN